MTRRPFPSTRRNPKTTMGFRDSTGLGLVLMKLSNCETIYQVRWMQGDTPLSLCSTPTGGSQIDSGKHCDCQI